MCFSGAHDLVGGPGALIRGGAFVEGAGAGPFTVRGEIQPSYLAPNLGFRCAR